jgi:hypothetical protein
MDSAAASSKFEAMDIFGYDKPFPGVQEGSDDEGNLKKG